MEERVGKVRVFALHFAFPLQTAPCWPVSGPGVVPPLTPDERHSYPTNLSDVPPIEAKYQLAMSCIATD